MDAFDLTTHLGAYLYRMESFYPGGLIGFMATEILDGYADAAGQESYRNERVLAVCGCLSTSDRWDKFKDEWQTYLKHEGFKPHRETGLYVFHTTEFKSGFDKLMPEDLTEPDKDRIYLELVRLVRKHSEYCFGFGVLLEDFKRLELEIPHMRMTYKQPGTFASHQCFMWNSYNAKEAGFNPSINYIFDQRDEFWGELFGDYHRKRRMRAHRSRTEKLTLNVASLGDGDKDLLSPLQAADIVAWECRTHFASLTHEHLTKQVPPKEPSPALDILRNEASMFRLMQYADMKNFMMDILQRSIDPEGKIGEGRTWTDWDHLMRDIHAYMHDEEQRNKGRLREEFFEKKRKQREENERKED